MIVETYVSTTIFPISRKGNLPCVPPCGAYALAPAGIFRGSDVSWGSSYKGVAAWGWGVGAPCRFIWKVSKSNSFQNGVKYIFI